MQFKERIFHAVLFEVLAVLLTTIGMAIFTKHETSAIFGTIVAISLTAVVWNFVFNYFFDKVFTGAREKRSIKLRTAHTVIFELGLLIFTIPLVAYLLNVDWWTAFVMDIGMTLFIMVYTFVFNWCYDHLRLRFVAPATA
ncbi:PACE efflux transporter [Caviibacterium pharyngocola]|uniref:Chlorhexidine efflux transporter domain-containing protein n=1 Tax=Caviibacterium pharyngocola TaxID=28159 RepID=A0A2M8RUC2_9PAST|nr:PACE efflux transporter [Caviibacterium pharyngocola]PJG82477.1 hypothetical protein CVP04_09075 [Caviibacterium pharyngocola]